MPRPQAARTDAIRRHNLSLIVEQVHLDGALSRAELTERLGLSRSTVGGLVVELAELGLLQESVPVGGTRVGRPSYLVQALADGPFVVAVDIDVAQLTTAAVGLGGTVLARHTVVTAAGPVSPESIAQHIAVTVPTLQKLARGRPLGIGISVPGIVERGTGTVRLAPNLGWHDAPLGQLMAEATRSSLPVTIGNDADLAVLAEHCRGSARGCNDVVYLMGRVGVGAGILADGRALRGSGGLAGEVGHTVLDPAGPECHCGGRGCVEMFIGDAALLRLAGRKLAAEGGAHAIEGGVAEVLRSAAAGNENDLCAVRALATALGRTVANVTNLLNPELVVMGGSLREVLLLAQPEIEAALGSNALDPARSMVQLRASALGEDASLLGAAELAFGPLLNDPWHELRRQGRG